MTDHSYPSPSSVRARIESNRVRALDDLRANVRLELRRLQNYTTSLTVPHGTRRADAEQVVAELRSGADPWDAELHWMCGPISFADDPATLIIRLPRQSAPALGTDDGWHTEGLPKLSAWVDVRVATGDVYTGEVREADAVTTCVILRGAHAAGRQFPMCDDGEYATWTEVDTAKWRRTGWRSAKRPSDESEHGT